MEQQDLNLLNIGAKAQSKSELYRILVVEGGLYLPPLKETQMLLVSQIAVGDKSVNISYISNYQ